MPEKILISSKLLINPALRGHDRSLPQLATQMQWMWTAPEPILQQPKTMNPEDIERSGLDPKDKIHEGEEGLL